jgi:pectate lyase
MIFSAHEMRLNFSNPRPPRRHCNRRRLASVQGCILKSKFFAALAGVLVSNFAFAQAGNPPATPSFAISGFATVAADGLAGTTGGGAIAPVSVHNAKEFQSAAERLDIKDKKARDNTPRVILVANDIDLGVLANQKGGSVLTSVGVVRVRPNTTIYSTGDGATIRGGTIEIHGAFNIIIRNLRFRDLWEFDPTGKYDKLGWDYVRITNAGKTSSHHVWVDHCDFGKVYDGQCDIVHGSDCITVSWCHFAGDERGPHKKSMLIGHSSSASNLERDGGRLNVSLHHNWWENIDDRAPRARLGNIHCWNNLIEGAQNATISVTKCVTLVENCVYRDALIATTFSHAKDNVSHEHTGTICVTGSKNENPRAPHDVTKADEKFEQENNFKSSVTREKLQFNPPADFKWDNRNELPYRYAADPVDAVPTLVKQFAGTGKLGL